MKKMGIKKYVSKNDTINRRCVRCGNVVLKETNVADYPFLCVNCDENMFSIETYIGADHTKEELEALYENARSIL